MNAVMTKQKNAFRFIHISAAIVKAHTVRTHAEESTHIQTDGVVVDNVNFVCKCK